tara:strand:+ start:237 stop:1961 length:1725 start_codon:yes stop_codon:yes gene_type:complete
MERSKSHNFWIGLKTNNCKPSDKVSPYVFYKYGGSGKLRKRKLPLEISFDKWDTKSKNIKKSLWRTFSDEVDKIKDIESKINGVTIDMTSGTLTLENAFNRLLDKSEDGLLVTWINTAPRLTRGAKKKYLSFLSSIESHLPKEYTPLRFTHLQDINSVGFIGETINYKSGLGNGAIDYLKMLDRVSDYAGLKVKKPFKENGYIKASADTDKDSIKFKDVLRGFNDMRTSQDFMAMNFWLYSLSLRGLGGMDICNISEDNIERSGDYKVNDSILPYYPDYWVDKYWTGHLGQKVFHRVKRTKKEKNRKMTILLNLLPSNLLHESLKNILLRTHPQYAYKGKDRLRLFNFMTLKKDEEVPEGKAKWKNLKDTIFPKIKRMIGGGIHLSRHTFIDTGELRLTEQEQVELLGQKTKTKGVHHYQSPHQIKTDLNHIKAIEEYGLMELIIIFFEVGFQKGFTDYKLSLGALKILQKGKLTTFTLEDQLKLEVLQQRIAERPNTRVVKGRVITSQREKSKELLDLENKRIEMHEFEKTDNKEFVSSEMFSLVKPKDVEKLQKEYENMSRHIAEFQDSLNQ